MYKEYKKAKKKKKQRSKERSQAKTYQPSQASHKEEKILPVKERSKPE